MNLYDLAHDHGIKNLRAFNQFLENGGYPVNNGEIDDSVAESAAKAFISSNPDIMAKDAGVNPSPEYLKWLEEKNQAVSKMLITSAASFDGYTITKYSGFISGDGYARVKRSNLESDTGQAIANIRRTAVNSLKSQAFELGCNAIVGVDFDYMTMDPTTAFLGSQYLEPYLFVVTANGNAVVIEKNE